MDVKEQQRPAAAEGGVVVDEPSASVLLVDDNPANLMAVETILAELGANLVFAHSGKEALRRLLEQDFAVIVLDVNMPDMNGFEAAALIRQRPRTQHTPIVFMTAISQTDAQAIHGYELGAVDYIYTPIAPEVIRAKLRVFVDLFRLNQALVRQSRQLTTANEQLEQRVQEIQHLNSVLQATVAKLDRDVAERKSAEARLRESETRLQILHEIDRAILAAASADEIAQAVVRRLRHVLRCERVSVLLFDVPAQTAEILAVDSEQVTRLPPGTTVPLKGQHVFGRCRRGRSGMLDNLAALPRCSAAEQALIDEGLRAYTCLPLMVGGQLIGALDLARTEPGLFWPASIELARHVADSMAVAVQNARLNAQVQLSRSRLQELSRRLVQVQEDERRVIALELHDEAGQSLTSLLLGLGILERQADGNTELISQIHTLKQMTNEVMEGLHQLAVDLRPASLDRLGLVPALQQYVRTINRHSSLEVELEAVGMDNDRLPAMIETTLYRVVQEAITNVARHARASHAEVLVHRRPDSLAVVVADNGTGFDAEAAIGSGRLGLLGMRERAEMLGGSLSIESRPGKGTTVFAEVPYQAAGPGASAPAIAAL